MLRPNTSAPNGSRIASWLHDASVASDRKRKKSRVRRSLQMVRMTCSIPTMAKNQKKPPTTIVAMIICQNTCWV